MRQPITPKASITTTSTSCPFKAYAPHKQQSVITGIITCCGTAESRAIQRAPPSIRANIITFATSTEPMIAYTASGFCRKSNGPGCRPCTINAPKSTAPITLPGTPSAISGISAPPTVALFAASEATMPSSLPLPNCSGVFDARLAVMYAASEPTFAPTPGNTPISVPKPEERRRFTACVFQVFHGTHAPSSPLACSTLPSEPVRSPRILPMANIPISTGISRKPSFNAVTSKVQRSSPVAGCTPGMAASTPSPPANKPRARVDSPMPANSASARITNEKYSNGPNRVDHSAIGSDNCHNASHDTNPPTSEAPIPSPNARPGRPALAMG